MRFVIPLFLMLAPVFAFADAGFNIERTKAPCFAVFKGIDKLKGYEFFKISINDERRGSGNIFDSSHHLYNNDSLRIYYKEGRRYWQGPIKILIRDKETQQFIDSFTLIADGYNLKINFTGVQDNKLKYTIDKSKANFPYELFPGDDATNAAVANRNKFILISLSVIGFLVLAFMFYKRRNTNIQ